MSKPPAYGRWVDPLMSKKVLLGLGLTIAILVSVAGYARDSLSRLLSTPAPIEICAQSSSWERPTEIEQARKWWRNGRYAGLPEPAVKYAWNHDFFLQYGSADIAFDMRNLSGLWTDTTTDLSRCDRVDVQDAVLRAKKIELWSLKHRVTGVRRLGNTYWVEVAPTARGYQVALLPRDGPAPLTFIFVDVTGKEVDRVVEGASLAAAYPWGNSR